MEHLKLDLSSIWIEKDFKDLGGGGVGGCRYSYLLRCKCPTTENVNQIQNFLNVAQG